METFIKKLHPKNKLILFLGNIEKSSFNINLDEKLQEEIVSFFKPRCKKIYSQQCKYYYYDDMKYIITQNGVHKCMKNKIHKYAYTDNAMVCSLQEINIPIDNFPPITTYHDTRVIERTIIQCKNFTVEIMDVIYSSGLISHECIIQINDWNDSIFQEFIQTFKYNINFNNFQVINHGRNNIMSII